jgi:uncharacterized protein (DUF2062 family)
LPKGFDLSYIGLNMVNLRRKIHYFYMRFRQLEGDPQKISLGMALGIFIAFTPTIPFHIILSLALAQIFRISRVATLLGVWISNPLTIPLMYYLSFIIGKKILYPHLDLSLPPTLDVRELLKLGWEINLALQLGGLVMAVPAGIIAYFLTLWAVKRYRQQKPSLPDRALHLPQDPLPPT